MAVEHGYKYKGEDTLYLVEIETETGTEMVRPFDQTGGGTSISSDDIEVSTKDRTGTEYGNVTQTVTLEGEIAEGDPFIKAMKQAIRNKEFVKIYEVNVLTNEAEYGFYKINSFDLEYPNGESSTYSLEGALFGSVTETTLTEIPDGAPEFKDPSEENGGGGVEG